MKGYIERRRQWWTLLSSLDVSIGSDSSLTDEFRGDLLLENAGISHTEKLLILTITKQDTPFEEVADALMLHHGQIHQRPRPSGKGKGRSKGKRMVGNKAVGPKKKFPVRKNGLQLDERKKRLKALKAKTKWKPNKEQISWNVSFW